MTYIFRQSYVLAGGVPQSNDCLVGSVNPKDWLIPNCNTDNFKLPTDSDLWTRYNKLAVNKLFFIANI